MQLDLPHLIEVRNSGASRTVIWSRTPSRPDMRKAQEAVRAAYGHGYYLGHSWPGDDERNAPGAWVNVAW